MLKDKNFNKVFAVIIAISLWAYVLGDINPTTSITIKDVPISYVNEEALEVSGKVVLSADHDTVNITISGSRTEVTKVNKSDFSVKADVEALSVGSNVVRLDVKGPDSVEITNVSIDKINVTVDELVTVNKKVNVTTAKNVDEDKEPYIVEQEMDTISVSGAKSLVQKVDSVRAVIDETELEGAEKTLTAKLEPVDSTGKTVAGVTLPTDSMSVTAIMHHIKTVDLEVPVNNANSDEYERSVSLPDKIVIKGADDVLANIDSIQCEKIDLNEYKETTNILLTPVLPDGVQVSADYSKLYAKLTVKELKKITLKVPNNSIKLLNTSDDLNYEVDTEDMTISIAGKENDLSGIDISNFTITADVKNLEAGTHKVKVKIESRKDFNLIQPSTEEVEITIE